MKIYLDTTCWIRTTESNDILTRFQTEEKEAILNFLDIIWANSEEFQVVSSKHQRYQIENKIRNTNPTQKTALEYVLAQIETLASKTLQYNPSLHNEKTAEFLTKFPMMPDREDARHIIISWLHNADYFVTTDWRSILNINPAKNIENVLASLIHPISPQTSKPVQIIDAKSFHEYIEKMYKL